MTAQPGGSAHIDDFTARGLPPRSEWPVMTFDLPELRYPPQLNCATVLLGDAVREGHGDSVALRSDAGEWTYAQLLEQSDRIANVLVHDLGIVPGNRVLLRGYNGLMLAAAWFAVMKVGAVAVPTMPMLRTHELSQICAKAQVRHALCDHRLMSELCAAMPDALEQGRLLSFGDGALERRMAVQAPTFVDVQTAVEDVCLLAFTSGTTGKPKATMHFHRDILAMADVVGGRLLRTGPDDVHLGSPPFAFTFGLGALLVFPLRFRASAALIEQPSPDALIRAIPKFGVTALFTAPTMYRNLVPLARDFDLRSLRRCVSAGEPLPKAISDQWFDATGIRLIDGIGATEMIHIFISAAGEEIRPGATGKPLPGYQAVVLDEQGRPQTHGSGRLAVRGPTGCRYLDDDRQRGYVVDGWNVTGDRYRIDEDGYFWFEARADDMIVSAGYNIAGPEVEAALLEHPAVREVAVVGAPDPARGQVVKAVVVLREGFQGDAALVRALQDHVKNAIAPYKYPRMVEFVAGLPKTPSGKIQRYALRQGDGPPAGGIATT